MESDFRPGKTRAASLLNTYYQVSKCSEKVVFEKIFLEWPNGR